jgi:mercuric ion transport protein
VTNHRLAGIGVGALAVVAVLCCAAPALIAAGALAFIGAAVRNWWVIGAAVIVVLGGLGYAKHRRRPHRRRVPRYPRRRSTSPIGTGLDDH